MFSSDGTGDFLSLSHLHFCHQGNLHFYGIINEEGSHLHFLAHHHDVVWRTAVAGGVRCSGGVWAWRAMLELWGRTGRRFVSFQETWEVGRFGYNKLRQSKQAGGAEGGEFFQVQIEASVSPHIKHSRPGLHSTLGPLETAAKKTLDQRPINMSQPLQDERE